jgi:CheY-like chemotaxis protein
MHSTAPRARAEREPLAVLIVEDNARMRSLIRLLLADAATEVDECADGASAERHCGRSQPDVVLMDIALGAGSADGITTARRIHDAYPLIRIVMVSENSGAPYRAAATAAGACAFVGKDALLTLPEVLAMVTTSALAPAR